MSFKKGFTDKHAETQADFIGTNNHPYGPSVVRTGHQPYALQVFLRIAPCRQVNTTFLAFTAVILVH